LFYDTLADVKMLVRVEGRPTPFRKSSRSSVRLVNSMERFDKEMTCWSQARGIFPDPHIVLPRVYDTFPTPKSVARMSCDPVSGTRAPPVTKSRSIPSRLPVNGPAARAGRYAGSVPAGDFTTSHSGKPS